VLVRAPYIQPALYCVIASEGLLSVLGLSSMCDSLLCASASEECVRVREWTIRVASPIMRECFRGCV